MTSAIQAIEGIQLAPQSGGSSGGSNEIVSQIGGMLKDLGLSSENLMLLAGNSANLLPLLMTLGELGRSAFLEEGFGMSDVKDAFLNFSFSADSLEFALKSDQSKLFAIDLFSGSGDPLAPLPAAPFRILSYDSITGSKSENVATQVLSLAQDFMNISGNGMGSRSYAKSAGGRALATLADNKIPAEGVFLLKLWGLYRDYVRERYELKLRVGNEEVDDGSLRALYLCDMAMLMLRLGRNYDTTLFNKPFRDVMPSAVQEMIKALSRSIITQLKRALPNLMLDQDVLYTGLENTWDMVCGPRGVTFDADGNASIAGVWVFSLADVGGNTTPIYSFLSSLPASKLVEIENDKHMGQGIIDFAGVLKKLAADFTDANDPVVLEGATPEQHLAFAKAVKFYDSERRWAGTYKNHGRILETRSLKGDLASVTAGLNDALQSYERAGVFQANNRMYYWTKRFSSADVAKLVAVITVRFMTDFIRELSASENQKKRIEFEKVLRQQSFVRAYIASPQGRFSRIRVENLLMPHGDELSDEVRTILSEAEALVAGLESKDDASALGAIAAFIKKHKPVVKPGEKTVAKKDVLESVELLEAWFSQLYLSAFITASTTTVNDIKDPSAGADSKAAAPVAEKKSWFAWLRQSRSSTAKKGAEEAPDVVAATLKDSNEIVKVILSNKKFADLWYTLFQKGQGSIAELATYVKEKSELDNQFKLFADAVDKQMADDAHTFLSLRQSESRKGLKRLAELRYLGAQLEKAYTAYVQALRAEQKAKTRAATTEEKTTVDKTKTTAMGLSKYLKSSEAKNVAELLSIIHEVIAQCSALVAKQAVEERKLLMRQQDLAFKIFKAHITHERKRAKAEDKAKEGSFWKMLSRKEKSEKLASALDKAVEELFDEIDEQEDAAVRGSDAAKANKVMTVSERLKKAYQETMSEVSDAEGAELFAEQAMQEHDFYARLAQGYQGRFARIEQLNAMIKELMKNRELLNDDKTPADKKKNIARHIAALKGVAGKQKARFFDSVQLFMKSAHASTSVGEQALRNARARMARLRQGSPLFEIVIKRGTTISNLFLESN